MTYTRNSLQPSSHLIHVCFSKLKSGGRKSRLTQLHWCDRVLMTQTAEKAAGNLTETNWRPSSSLTIERPEFNRLNWCLRRFAAVSPFCFGYPAQPDIASWRIRIIHNHFDRPTLFFATRRQGRCPRSLEAFIFTPVAFLSVSRHDARAPLERTKDVDFRRVQLSIDWMMLESEEWIRRKRRRRRSIDEQASGCMVDLLNLSWAVLCGRQCDFSFFVLVDLGSKQSFIYYGAGGLQLKTPVGADNVSSMSIWWVYSQSASQHFFGSVVLQSSFSLSCTYALGEWSVVSHRWSRRTPAGFCIWSNQWGYFTERGRKNWTFTKSELRVNCFYTDMKQLHLHWLNKIFMLYQCTVYGGLGFLFKDPEPLIFFDNELVVQ